LLGQTPGHQYKQSIGALLQNFACDRKNRKKTNQKLIERKIVRRKQNLENGFFVLLLRLLKNDEHCRGRYVFWEAYSRYLTI
jgi:hypothetical protein